MITNNNNIFHITTKNISYIIGIRSNRFLENLYFGRKIPNQIDYSALTEKFANPYGNSVLINGDKQDKYITLDNICLEYSFHGTGDYRSLPLLLKINDNTYSSRFIYDDYVIYKGIFKDSTKTAMPFARDNEKEEIETLEIILKDDFYQLELRLIYTVFPDCDVITRRCVLMNHAKETVTIEKIMSLQVDLPGKDYYLSTFDGLWARERHQNEKELVSGSYVIESMNGTSSNRHNPLILLAKKDCAEEQGESIAFNLIYSGNHKEIVEVSEYGKLRILSGINNTCLSYQLKEEETFYTPEAVLTYSSNGKNGVSKNMHSFVLNHIIPPQFAYKERPILINNWEATYFNFNQYKIMGLAKEAKNLGMELFVLDDGWFGERKDDTSSLGDWTVNERKLGCSLKTLVEKINKQGLAFGIWIEPEMVSENSKLYREHSDWAIAIPGREVYLGRNQLVLDYTNAEVRGYIISTIRGLLKSANIRYVKWDMNRPLCDAFSKTDAATPGEFYHKYVLGLYEVLSKITKEFPDVLFEGCSAGGNRFDLGMLYYMPQIWTSDDTDPHERMQIQGGTSYGYPLSCMGAHVSASPNHQTLRNTSLETRFQVACFGDLGYELDITKLTSAEKKIMKKQIEFYKQYRMLLQFGQFKRIVSDKEHIIWQVLSEDKSKAISLLYRFLARPNDSADILYAKGLKGDAMYHVSVRETSISIKEFGNLVNQISPISIKEEGILQSAVNKVYMLKGEKEEYVVSGSLLMHAGIKLKQRFIGTGYNEDTRIMGDFSSRLYIIEEIRETAD